MSDDLMDSESISPRGALSSAPGLLANLRLVSLGTIVSRILGLLRDSGMAALFGAGTTLDAFILAFRIPNLSRQLLGEGALSTAFLPVFLRSRDEQGDEVARATLTAVALVLTLILTAALVLAEAALGLVWYTIDLSESSRLLVILLVILMPYMVLICVAALFCAALHALRQFFWPVLVPILLNGLWLIALCLIARMSIDASRQAIWLAVSITAAGILQLATPLVALQRSGLGLVRTWRAGWPHVRDVFRTMVPIVIGMSLVQTGAILDSLLAWVLSRPDGGGAAFCEALGIPPLLESGTVSALYYGQRMYQFPLGVFGVALGTVLYPVLTQHAQRGQYDLLRSDLARGIRIVIVIALPASAGLCVLAWPLTLALFRHGRFDAQDARMTSQMIAIFGTGVWAYISIAILNRAFYATGDRLTPMRLGLLALVLNLVLNIVLVIFLGGNGLALGSVLASGVQVILTLRQLDRRVGPLDWKELGGTLVKGLLATAVMSAACLTVIAWMPPPATTSLKLALLAAPCLTGAVVYFALSRLLGLTDLDDLLRKS